MSMSAGDYAELRINPSSSKSLAMLMVLNGICVVIS